MLSYREGCFKNILKPGVFRHIYKMGRPSIAIAVIVSSTQDSRFVKSRTFHSIPEVSKATGISVRAVRNAYHSKRTSIRKASGEVYTLEWQEPFIPKDPRECYYSIMFNLSYRYIDDLISFNNKRFKEFISDIYPKELTISETTESTSVTSYLNLLFTRDRSNNITTKLYDKRDAFGFHIVNFPFMSSNIPSAPAYGVYASQLVRYARCCSNYSDFLIRHRALVKRLLSQGYKVNRLSNTFKKFYGRHTDLVGQYKKNVCQMFADSIS